MKNIENKILFLFYMYLLLPLFFIEDFIFTNSHVSAQECISVSENISYVPSPTSISVSSSNSLNIQKVSVSTSEIVKNSKPNPKEILPEPEYSEEDLKLLATTIYFEASPTASLESCMAVGWVVQNRLEDKTTWNCETYSDVIFMKNPVQFSVTLKEDFYSYQDEILQDTTLRAKNAINAARLILSKSNLYKLPSDVQYFYGDKDKRVWGRLTYFNTFDGNSFFYK